MISRSVFRSSIRALLVVGLCTAGHAATTTYNSVVWTADNVFDGTGTGTINGSNTVTYFSPAVSNSGQTFDTAAFAPSWNASPATNGGGTLAYTSTLAGVLGTNGPATVQTINFSTAVVNPILLVDFANTGTQISITSGFAVLSISNCNAGIPGIPITCTAAGRTPADGFAVRIFGTYGPGNPLTFTYADTNGANTIGFSIADLLPPTVAKTFTPASIPAGGTSTVTVTITNPNTAVPLNGVAFSDTLPAGLVFATPSNGLAQTCGGVAVATSAPPQVLSLSSGSLATGASCTVSVNVTASTAGSYNNSVTVSATGAPSSNSNTATLTVLAPPVLSKSFADPMLTFSPATTLTFNVTNPNTSSLSGIGFTDNLPTGLTVSSLNGLTSNCGGTISAVPGSSTISLSGAALAPSASCTLSVSVTGAIGSDGPLVNTTTAVTSTEGGTGNAATSTIIDNQYILFLWWFS